MFAEPAFSALRSPARPEVSKEACATRGRFVVSIHDVSPGFEGAVDRLVDLTIQARGGRHISMLVVPDHWQGGAITTNSHFSDRLREWSDAGVEMILHGWSHRDESVHGGWSARLRARHMTAGEGEFLGLSRHEAHKRLRDGRALLEDITGRSVTAFVAPAWLYGKGARNALADGGFTIAEDHMRVWNPSTGASLARGPVISWASRSPARIASSLAFARMAPVLLARQELVRIALHPGDTTVPSLMRSIDRTIRYFAERREAIQYADL